MKKQLVRISILQSSKIATILYFLMGFIYVVIGIPMIIFGNDQLRIMGIIYCAMPILLAGQLFCAGENMKVKYYSITKSPH